MLRFLSFGVGMPLASALAVHLQLACSCSDALHKNEIVAFERIAAKKYKKRIFVAGARPFSVHMRISQWHLAQ